MGAPAAQGARALAQLPIDALKFHQLQIVRGTRLANQYRADPASVPTLSLAGLVAAHDEPANYFTTR